MISGSDFLINADSLLGPIPPPSEVARRRAVSGAYYGLFHILIEAAAKVIAGADKTVQARLVRAYNHRTLRDVCQQLVKPQSDRNEAAKTLLPLAHDDRLAKLARWFIELQRAREDADYDLGTELTHTAALAYVATARRAAEVFAEIQDYPETRLFLISLLLADRWPRRG